MENPQLQETDRRPNALGDLRVLPDELICLILENLSHRDVVRLSCVSSVFYIFCNEEPLWMNLCLQSAEGLLEYKNSWKQTVLYRISHAGTDSRLAECCQRRIYFEGFSSLFLYRRWYRCFATLDSFCMDTGTVDRKKDISHEQFVLQYDAKKPVLLTGLVQKWPANHNWTVDQLLCNYGDVAFKISQRGNKKILMKLKDYVSYMYLQHDEDPLYVFDDRFGEVAPNLLKDYTVPHLFQEDFFNVLDRDERPSFRWLIIGPERSGASWHVDPALTSAWNTLLCGKKRWALYPPGRVPSGVTVHVNTEDGEIYVNSPSSLQWWLEYYPLLAVHDKPIECTQLPGETLLVPSGWWHCVLNLETTIAVTQNFVNASNFEFVCLDMAPGHLHKGVSRAGLLAIRGNSSVHLMKEPTAITSCNSVELTKSGKRPRICHSDEERFVHVEESHHCQVPHFSYDIRYLSMFLDEESDHYNSFWRADNCLGQRELRQWLHRLWSRKPEIKDLIWKGACLSLNAQKWLSCMTEICFSHNLPPPMDDEKLPVGTGSNPVYLVGDYVIKIYVEGGLESAIYSLGTELEFYNLLSEVNSPLKNHVPSIVASGFLFHIDGAFKTVSWDGKILPDEIDEILKAGLGNIHAMTDPGSGFGVWSKELFGLRELGNLQPNNDGFVSVILTKVWPYAVIKRCKGAIFAYLRHDLSVTDVLNLASFLGEQLRNIHLVPLPPSSFLRGLQSVIAPGKDVHEIVYIPEEWCSFVRKITRRREDVLTLLTQWAHSIPEHLMKKVDEYLPYNPIDLLDHVKDEDGSYRISGRPVWLHTDITDDNIHMEPCSSSVCLHEGLQETYMVASYEEDDLINCQKQFHTSHILDFSDLSVGDPLYDVIPVYVDVFRGSSELLERFLESYRLPLAMKHGNTCSGKLQERAEKIGRISYRAMCYCILHEDNILGTIFSLWRELRTAETWEEVEEVVWGKLNEYEPSVEDSALWGGVNVSCFSKK